MPISPKEVGVYSGIDGIILSTCISHIDKILRVAASFLPHEIMLPGVDLSEYGLGVAVNPGFNGQIRDKLSAAYKDAGWTSVTFKQRRNPNDTIVLDM